jgi:hypothetical protein
LSEEGYTLFRDLGSKKPEAEVWLIKSLINGILLSVITAGEMFPLEGVREVLLEKYIPIAKTELKSSNSKQLPD